MYRRKKKIKKKYRRYSKPVLNPKTRKFLLKLRKAIKIGKKVFPLPPFVKEFLDTLDLSIYVFTK